MQVQTCRAEAAITIKQNQQCECHLYNERVIVHCLIVAQRQRLVNILSKAAPYMDGQREGKKKEKLWTCRW